MPHAGPPSHPHIVLITLDCVRPDFLGCYGCRAVRTPNIDRMAACGVVFEQAVTLAPNTWVGHAGILTGLYPPEHGLRSPYDRIQPHVATLASILKARGYRTAGFPGNDLAGSRMGFGAGFDLFFEQYAKSGALIPEPPAGLLAGPTPTVQGTRQINANVRNDWGAVLRAADEWLSGTREPVFLWFHYLDTHHLPELDLPDYFRFSRDPHWQFYEGKISYADERCVGAISDMLLKHGLYEDALVIILSDHGESLRPGSPPHHNGDLADDVLRVPLIMFGERFPWKGLRIRDQVRTMDLVPALTRGDGFIPGPPFLPAYAENEPLGLSCVRTNEWKYVRSPSGDALYHLPSDPGERVNVVERHPETAGSLLRELQRVRSLGTSPRMSADRDEEETRRLLQALGYVS